MEEEHLAVKRFRIKNWKKFQHYTKRRPLWIKLYHDLLDNLEWHALSGESAKGLVMLWLIASEGDGDGYLPDSKTLAFRLRISENRVNALLSDCYEWLEQSASKPLASCYQVAIPETETEKREEKRRAPAAPSHSIFTGQHFTVTQKQDSLLAEAFPWVNRQVEYRKADSWMEANPSRRPGKSSRFLHNWFQRIEAPRKENGNGTGKLTGTELLRHNAEVLGFSH